LPYNLASITNIILWWFNCHKIYLNTRIIFCVESCGCFFCWL